MINICASAFSQILATEHAIVRMVSFPGESEDSGAKAVAWISAKTHAPQSITHLRGRRNSQFVLGMKAPANERTTSPMLERFGAPLPPPRYVSTSPLHSL